MRYLFIGKHNPSWTDRPIERRDRSDAMLEKIGIKHEMGTYVQGAFDFVDVVDAPDHEAMLAFSLWYRREGFGTIDSMPALSFDQMIDAVDRIA
jgi:uncharacterized protein with GYD domain